MPPQTGHSKLASFAPALDQFNLVAFRSVDKRYRAPIAIGMRAVGQRTTLGRSLSCKFFQVVHFKREMGQVRPNHYWAALIILAKLDLFLALRCLEEYKLRAAPGGVVSCFLQTEDVSLKGNRLFQIGHAITGMQ